MNEVLGIPLSVATPSALSLMAIALIITSFARGWIVSKLTVETLLTVQNLRISEAIQRGDDYRTAWELSEKRADLLQDLVDNLSIVGVSVDKILKALPPVNHSEQGDYEPLP